MDHPADVGFAARGRTLEETFAAAAQAMCEFGWKLSKVKPREKIEIRARAGNLEDLLFSWLSEILFLCDAEKWVFKRFQVHRINKVGLATEAQRAQRQTTETVWDIACTAFGEKFDKERHPGRTYIKAVTYHQLAVKQTAKGWEATVYLDV